ncbi:MAG TPA: GspE/PulE family protein [Candidatus Moranbacteria bacterium]|nr:GspE/PulE family protein [Candidatus Moranbacteria bacterium]HRZ33494.1 GspE/PulE family protein [Candidatus Moranbacteria bacterium]
MVKVSDKQLIRDKEKETQTGKLLKKMSGQSEEEIASQLAAECGLAYVDLNIFPVSSDDMRSISEEESRRYKMIVFQKAGKEHRIGVVNPTSQETISFIEKLKNENGWLIHLYVISNSSFNKIWKRYAAIPFLENLESMQISLSGKDLDDFDKEFGNLLELKKRINEIPTSQIISIIMAGSVKMKASDIHFEPGEQEVRMRFRIDGELQDIASFPLDTYHFILSRIKMMGKMKINVRDIAQDGHFSVDIENGKINVRTNIIPGNHGESIVMRILSQADIMLGIEDLGLRGLAYERLQKEVSKPHGMILTTGPTGSGKTTTLYALVNKLNTAGVKIITIEDPIEYEVKNISQTQVEKGRSYTFAEGLRAIVRQDPDVILVGEIRDDETADIAVNAALTGHLVLSTLHTNNAPASIPRFVELGIKPNLISPSVNAFIAQRLVRKLCPHCREEYAPARETIDSIKKILSIISPKAKVEIPKTVEKLYRPVGCSKCHNIGFKGRIGIFEILTITEPIEKLILEMGSEREITQAALEDGMITMAQDGILKAIEGLTSMEEVWHATGQTEFLEEIYTKLMEQSLSRSVEIHEEDLKLVSENMTSIESLGKFLQNSNQKEVANYIFASSLLLNVGDIHIEPEEKVVKIRYRMDGILQTIAEIPINEYPSLLGNIKFLSGFSSEIRGGVMDSRFTIALEKPYKNITETKVDVRVSIILGGYGETVVMRLLNKSSVALDLEKLGIRKQNMEKIIEETRKPNGIFLNTGPTGSGKTTTLYSIMKILNKPEVKIISVEDPIEYQLEGILQTSVNDNEGYTFGTALRALLRQNPDIMMIGEIRDEETANIAVQAALTGHSILSTLHTNNAAGSIQRLINMGVRSDDLATAVNALMAQRLVRKLCDCKTKRQMTEEEKNKVKKILQNVSDKSGVAIPPIESVYEPKGCDKCNGVGYKGRTTISEVFVIDRDIEELIMQSASATQLQDKAVENGMITMEQDGILKVLEGETTFDEVDRVV